MPRNSHQDAIDESTFKKLQEATAELEHPFDVEATAILVFGGRLGMRAGEIAHVSEDWVNWEREVIEVPRFHDCDCGYCHQQAAQEAAHREDATVDETIEERWQPKTPQSARAIPFGFDPFVRAVVEGFFERFDQYEHSRASINRRVDRLLEAADLPKDTCYPHALRATAATHHAYSGVPTAALQSMMGWAQLTTAQKYIRLSGGATEKALLQAHGD
jgi:integrase